MGLLNGDQIVVNDMAREEEEEETARAKMSFRGKRC